MRAVPPAALAFLVCHTGEDNVSFLHQAAGLGMNVTFLVALVVTMDHCIFFQDVDAAYANKVELQAKVDSMDQDIKFFKCLFEAVSFFAPRSPGVQSFGQWLKL